jgi:hypothetical protein
MPSAAQPSRRRRRLSPEAVKPHPICHDVLAAGSRRGGMLCLAVASVVVPELGIGTAMTQQYLAGELSVLLAQ